MKTTLTAALLCVATMAMAQRRPRDLVVLKNGNTATGKVVAADSLKLTLLRHDHSTENYPWQQIDSVRGLALKTRFFSPSLGFGHYSYWSTFLLQQQTGNALSYRLRTGTLWAGKWSRWVQLVLMPSPRFGITRFSVGAAWYFPQPYIQPLCFYTGAEAGFTFVAENRNFFTLGFHPGVEYWHKGGTRFFAELDVQRAIFNINKNTTISLTAGVRLGKELAKTYRHINRYHRLPPNYLRPR